jgi:multidrug efflux pump subunit AcrA (membrane-fusion protein)
MDKLKLFWTWIIKDRKRIIGAAILVILTIIGIWKLTAGNGHGVTYQTSKVEKGTIVSSVSASGQVLTTNILSITTEASGVVKKVNVKDGDKVYAGQKLAEITLDTAGLEKNAQAYASYISALNGVNSANNSYRSAVATAEKVLDEVKGHDSDETYAQKETRTKAEVARDNAYDGIRQAQANLTSATYNYKATSPTITAPFAGVIGSVNLVEGMVLESASSTMLVLTPRG